VSRRIRRDMHKRVSSSGYQQIQGDLEVQGNFLGPTVTGLASAIAAISATSTTPVKLSAPVAIGGMRSVTLHWVAQYTLTTFSHYEVQVSEDSLTWYSLKTDGTGWGATLNATTSVPVPMCEHANIPLILVEGVLVGKTLYYRVRQVTKSGAVSAWSDPVEAKTRAVEDIVIQDQFNRYIEISSHKGIYADDRQGHIIHDVPNAPMLNNSYSMGHLYWMRESTAEYTLVHTHSPTYGGWVTLTTVLNGNTNVKGIRIKYFLQHVPAVEQDNMDLSLSLRPFGSGWAVGSDNMCSVGGFGLVDNDFDGASIGQMQIAGVQDTPVDSLGRFEYYASSPAGINETLTMIQIGIWV
jgi:hypothetical protein